MAKVTAPNGSETLIRVVVYREGESYVAQCLEYDVAAHGPEIDVAIERLELALEADFDVCEARGKKPCDTIPPAQNYFHKLWDKKSLTLKKTVIETGARDIEFAFAKAA